MKQQKEIEVNQKISSLKQRSKKDKSDANDSEYEEGTKDSENRHDNGGSASI